MTPSINAARIARRMSLGLAGSGAIVLAALVLGAALPAAAEQAPATANAAGVIRLPSAYDFDETVTRLKGAIAAKGIRFFDEIDQSQLGASARIPLRPSKLLLFGNPPLGVQFLTSNPIAGLDWPVRMLVVQDADGKVWVAWNDFRYIADRYAIADRDAAFKMASEVSGSIASAVAGGKP